MFLATNDAFDPNVLHQPRHRTAGNVKRFAAHLVPDLAHPIDLVVLLPDAFDLGLQRHIPLRPIRQQVGVRPLGHVIVEGRRGNRQVPADRLEPDGVTVLFDEERSCPGPVVKLRLGKICARLSEDLVGLLQLPVFALQSIQLLSHLAGHASALTSVHFDLLYPLVQRLGCITYL